MEYWADFWYRYVSAAFLKGYLEKAKKGDFLPNSIKEIEILLVIHLIEKALYEIGYEMKARPEWVSIPLRGLLELLEDGQKS